MEDEFKKISSLEELMSVINEDPSTCGEYFVKLGGFSRSWKTIGLSGEVDKNGEAKLYIMNEIDDSEEVLSKDELMSYSIIGEAIKSGSLYFAWR